MKFIRFGDSLLNLEHVIVFRKFGIDSDFFRGMGHGVQAITAEGPCTEAHESPEAAEKRFKELSDYLVDEKHLTTKSGGEPKSRVMTASEAVNIPDIVGKRVMVEAVVEDIEYYHPDNLFCVQLEFDFKHEKFTKWVHKSTLIEVIELMTDLTLSEGQEFYANGQRYVIRGGVTVAEAKRGPLGGELVEFNSVEIGSIFYARFIKENSAYGMMSVSSSFNFNKCDPVEINVPQPHQAKGRVMTAGEAARLPDIVGKRVALVVDCIDHGDSKPLSLHGSDGWIDEDIQIEVLD